MGRPAEFSFALVACGAGYLALAWLTGLSAPSGPGWPGLAGGLALMAVVVMAVLIMAESVIEDWVKLAMFTLGAVAIWQLDLEPPLRAVVQALALGPPCGAAAPLLLRPWCGVTRSGAPPRSRPGSRRRPR